MKKNVDGHLRSPNKIVYLRKCIIVCNGSYKNRYRGCVHH